MKGQTAVEYLMVYGWAILIILIVAGVLWYFGVFAPNKFLENVPTNKTETKSDLDMTCEELEAKLRENYVISLRSSDYIRNLLLIMQLKGCKL